MDALERRCRDAATFDFWTDYLGLCALVGPAAALRHPEQRFALLRPFQPAGAGGASQGGCAGGAGPLRAAGRGEEGAQGGPRRRPRQARAQGFAFPGAAANPLPDNWAMVAPSFPKTPTGSSTPAPTLKVPTAPRIPPPQDGGVRSQVKSQRLE
ncbi:unnamed protein product [Caretta caretta]